jgi:hypothetical protein
MLTTVSDLQTIGETEAKAFGATQQGRTNAFFTLKNVGVNTISFRFQQYVSAAWADVGASGTVYNTTLAADAETSISLVDLAPQTRLLAYASGGSVLSFAATRYFNWTAGGYCPLMSA